MDLTEVKKTIFKIHFTIKGKKNSSTRNILTKKCEKHKINQLTFKNGKIHILSQNLEFSVYCIYRTYANNEALNWSMPVLSKPGIHPSHSQLLTTAKVLGISGGWADLKEKAFSLTRSRALSQLTRI